MRIIPALVLATLALAVSLPAVAQPGRHYDNEVKSLLEQSRKTYERFWDALDNTIKNSTYKGPSGEWNVKKIGEDYKGTIETAQKRMSDSYSASDEVTRVLTDANRFNVSLQGSTGKGASEWQAHANVLGRLAEEFGCTFPLAAGQLCRRYTDREVVAATAGIEASGKQLASAVDNALKKDKATPEATRKALVAEVKRLGQDAKVLGSAVKGRKPASAQATTLLAQGRKVSEALTSSAAATALQGSWTRVSGQLDLLAAAFRQSR